MIFSTKQLGVRIARARRRKGWSQQILADFATLERKTIMFIERGDTDAYVSTIVKIAYALDLPIEKLLTDDLLTIQEEI